MRNANDRAIPGLPKTMTMKLPPGWFYAALIIVLAAWILHSFLQAMLAACVTAIASWPLYTRFAARLPRRMGRSSRSLIFTLAMTVFVLGPLMFAFGALLTEAHATAVGDRCCGHEGNRRSSGAGERATDRAMARRSLAKSARALPAPF